jgi:hypothetical protein
MVVFPDSLGVMTCDQFGTLVTSCCSIPQTSFVVFLFIGQHATTAARNGPFSLGDLPPRPQMRTLRVHDNGVQLQAGDL